MKLKYDALIQSYIDYLPRVDHSAPCAYEDHADCERCVVEDEIARLRQAQWELREAA
jgi:hypothetical protein